MNWGQFYDEYGGYVFLEWLRRESEKDVDFVLIDSRTGITEMGGVCTQHLADVVVLLFAPNDANLNGVLGITKLLLGENLKQLRGVGRPLAVYPVPSRVDTQGATDQLASFEKRFRNAFSEFATIDLNWCWDSKIRYVTSYSYEEQILFLDKTGHADLNRSYAEISKQILLKWEERLSFAERVSSVETRTSRQGDEHPDSEPSRQTIQRLAATAREKFETGDFVTAENLLTSARTLAELDLGPDHSDTIAVIDQLALIRKARGDVSGAKSLLEQVLAFRRRSLGDEHPSSLSTASNLASTLITLREFPAARSLQDEVSSARRRILGNEHPDTLSALNDLTSTLAALGEFSAAKGLQEEVYSTRRRVLGNEHPDTLSAMSNLAAILAELDDRSTARALQEQVYSARRRILGDEHPDTISAMSNLASLLVESGELLAARSLQEQVLNLRRRVLGEIHPMTLTAMDELAATLFNMGEISPARILQEQVLAGRRSVLGEEHADTNAAKSKLELTLLRQGDPQSRDSVTILNVSEKPYDVFVTYSRRDDEPAVGLQRGWVSRCVEALKNRLRVLLAGDPNIWMDHSLAGNVDISPTMLEAVRQSKTMLILLSRSYLMSAWCQRELGIYLEANPLSHNRDNIFLVELEPIDRRQLHPRLRELMSIRFWELPSDDRVPRPERFGFSTFDDEHYWRQLNELAHGIVIGLRSYSDRNAGVVSASGRKPTVWVAEPSDDLSNRWLELSSAINQAGAEVRPHSPDTYEKNTQIEFEQAVRSDLKSAIMAIQLLSGVSGRRIPNSDLTYIELQNSLARAWASEKELTFLSWRPPDLSLSMVASSTQHRLLVGSIASGFEEFRQQVLANLRSLFVAKLTFNPKVAESTSPVICVLVAPEDRQIGHFAAQLLSDLGVEVLFSPESTPNQSPANFRAAFEDMIRFSEGVVIIYGCASPSWVQSQYAFARKMMGHRRDGIWGAILDCPPANKPQHGVFSRNLITIDCRDGLTKEVLGPFKTALGRMANV